MQSEFENILLDTQKEYRRSNRMKDKIIVVLIVLMFLEAIIGYCGFVWYESQFDYVTTEQTTQDIDLSTEGDNASAEYNDVQGNQYNDNADQIRSRKVYHTNVATDTASFVVSACELCKTGFNFPTIPVVTP